MWWTGCGGSVGEIGEVGTGMCKGLVAMSFFFFLGGGTRDSIASSNDNCLLEG